MTDTPSTPNSTDLDAPLNGLEQVIDAAMADPVHWRAFEQLLPTLDLFVAPEGEIKGADGMRVVRPGEQIDLRGARMGDGTIAAAMFSDPRRLQAVFGADQAFIAMNARHLLQMFRDRPVLLNPHSSRTMLFKVEDVAALLAAADAVEAAAAARGAVRPTGTVQLGSPEHEPTAILERLKQALSTETGVDAAWLARAHWAETNAWGWYLDVRSARPQPEIKAMTQRALTGVPFGAETLDIIVAPTGETDGIGIRIV